MGSVTLQLSCNEARARPAARIPRARRLGRRDPGDPRPRRRDAGPLQRGVPARPSGCAWLGASPRLRPGGRSRSARISVAVSASPCRRPFEPDPAIRLAVRATRPTRDLLSPSSRTDRLSARSLALPEPGPFSPRANGGRNMRVRVLVALALGLAFAPIPVWADDAETLPPGDRTASASVGARRNSSTSRRSRP